MLFAWPAIIALAATLPAAADLHAPAESQQAPLSEEALKQLIRDGYDLYKTGESGRVSSSSANPELDPEFLTFWQESLTAEARDVRKNRGQSRSLPLAVLNERLIIQYRER